MMQETANILQSMPYNSYEDLLGAIMMGKARMGLSLSACRQIAATKKPFYANYGMHYGFIPSAILTVATALYTTNYLLLLLLPLEVVFTFVVYLLRNLRVKHWPIAVMVLFVDLFLMRLPLFMFLITVSWLMCTLACRIWQKKTHNLSFEVMQQDESAFICAYNSNNLIIEDCYGNRYDKLREITNRTEKFKKLLKVIEIGAGAKNVDAAIAQFAKFYIQKGKNIPDELWNDEAPVSESEKMENLLKVLEIGIGVSGIDNVTNRLITFYKAKGASFPFDS